MRPRAKARATGARRAGPGPQQLEENAMYTLWDFLTHTKGVAYVVAFALLLCFIPFWSYLTDRERK